MKRKPNKSGKGGQAKHDGPPIPPPVIKGDQNTEGQNNQPCCNTVCKYTKEPTHWTRYIEAACAIALVLITGTYTYYARQQAGAAIVAANAAKSAGDTAHDALVLDQRPWVGLMGGSHISAEIAKGSPIRIHLEIQNVGKTPALDESSVHKLTNRPIHDPMPSFDNYSQSEAGPTITLMPNAIADVDLMTKKTGDHGSPIIEVLSDAGVTSINTGQVQLYVYGSIWYNDTFKNPHRTDYCLQYITPINSKSAGSFGACPVHNYAD